jgi:uncharacterized protein YraI
MDTQRHNRQSVLTKLFIVVALAATLVSLGLITGAAGASSSVQVATLTPTSGQIVLPTATPTLIGGPTATPSRTPTLVPVLAEAIGEANLRSGPGLDFDLVGTLSAGNPVPVVGRSVRFPWLLVLWQDAPDGRAWVFEQLVQITGDITTVPIVTEPAPPTIDPTLAAIQATATVVLQTPGAIETATAAALIMPTGVYMQTPDAQGGIVVGMLPTFTPPPPYVQPQELPQPQGTSGQRGGIPPAVLIIALGAMGLLTLFVGVLKRFS